MVSGARVSPGSGSASKRSIRRFVITEKAFSWLKAATTAFTFKTLLRHYAKRALTPRSLNVKLGPQLNYHKGRTFGWTFFEALLFSRARPLARWNVWETDGCCLYPWPVSRQHQTVAKCGDVMINYRGWDTAHCDEQGAAWWQLAAGGGWWYQHCTQGLAGVIKTFVC